jgi:hypothetical protein
MMAFEQSEPSPRELAIGSPKPTAITSRNHRSLGYESLIASPAFFVIKVFDEFRSDTY